MSLCGLEEYDLRWSSPAGGLVTTLGRQILKSNGLASPYSQLKWKFSIKTTQLKTLKIFEPNSQAKMAPDNRIKQELWFLLCLQTGTARSSGSELLVITCVLSHEVSEGRLGRGVFSVFIQYAAHPSRERQ
jgi:hypothetical protein